MPILSIFQLYRGLNVYETSYLYKDVISPFNVYFSITTAVTRIRTSTIVPCRNWYQNLVLDVFQSDLILWLIDWLVFNTTFNNISVKLWRRKPEDPEKNHWPVASHRQTLSHNVVSTTPRQGRIWTHNVSGDSQWLHK